MVAFNGSGTYNLPAGNPVVTGTTISSTWANSTLSDVATALTNCVTRDGQSPATANLPLGGFKLTNVGQASATGDALAWGKNASVSGLVVGTISGLLKGSTGTVSAATSGTDYAPATSGSAILKGNGLGGFSSAVSGTDYAPATSGSSILYGNASGGFNNVSIGAGLSFVAGTLDCTVSGGEKIAQSATVATTSGTSVGITGIPSWAKRITVQINGVGVSVGGLSQIQIGSGSYVTSGYKAIYSSSITASTSINTNESTSGFVYSGLPIPMYGFVTLVLVGASANTWAASWVFNWPGTLPSYYQYNAYGSGFVSLSGTLDRLQLNCTGSGGSYNAGSFSLIYEG